MARCTWEPCAKQARHDQHTADGSKVWAKLCDEHHAELQKRIDSGSARQLIAGWVKANGGPAKLARKL